MTKPHQQDCPIAQMLNLFGDRWTWLILREAFYGTTRFTVFQRRTGIARNLLSQRLELLVDEGILQKRDIGERGQRFEYRLTQKGVSLNTVMIAMVQWGNAHLYEHDAQPVAVVERASGAPIAPLTITSQAGKALSPAELAVVAGPAARSATRLRVKPLDRNPT